jgi:hypothetical protein
LRWHSSPGAPRANTLQHAVILAHALNQSGPHVEVLIVAAGFLLLGVVFFIQKSVKPVVSVTLVVVAAAMATGAFVLGPSNPASQGRRVVVREPKPGDVVPAGKAFRLDVAVLGGKLATSRTAADGGHLHVLVDGAVTSMPPTTTPRLAPLEPGKHELTVEFVNSQHFSYEPRVTDTIEITAK